MSSKIRVLDEHTINKIAAGEVIENPSSVVKELVENSIDAGATEISVEIKEGGRQMIRITDNGCGMSPDDAVLCLERHATSKIREPEDILCSNTMGFRGEAIPSIASISKFTLLTCPFADKTDGTMVIVDGGRQIQICAAARSQGTTMEVKSLFFNVPVRKKFQRSPSFDENEILKVMTTISLANPSIKFELFNDKNKILVTKRPSSETFIEQLEERIHDVLGKEFSSELTAVEGENDECRIEGYIGLPTFSRSNRSGQFLFINKRPVFSPTVSYAVRDGYSTTLPTQRHPTYVLFLTVPGALVDVNVHPQKKEVRLRKEQEIKKMISKAVDNALNQAGTSFTSFVEEDTSDLLPNAAELYRNNVFHSPTAFAGFAEINEEPLFTEPEKSSEPSRSIRTEMRHEAPQEPMRPLFEIEESEKPVFKVLATIPGFILLESFPIGNGSSSQDGLCLVDQRAAHSRIIFEKLQDSHNGSDIEIQALLIPYTIELNPIEASVISAHLDSLNQLGIQIKEFGNHTFTIDGLPHIFGNIDIQAFINETLREIQQYQDSNLGLKEIEKKIAAAATRNAIRQRQRLSVDEANHLIAKLVACKKPLLCPFGSSTVTHISNSKIRDLFHSSSVCS